MGKYLVTCSIAILVVLLQTDVIVSVSRRGGSRSSSSRKPSRPSHHQPSRPVHHQPSKPVHHKPSKPVQNKPILPVQNPAPPQHNPPINTGRLPASDPQNPAYRPPPYNPAYRPPPQNPAHPPPYPGHQPQNPAHPPPYPGHQPQNPAHPPPYPGHQPQNPAHPPPYPGQPPQNPAHPPPYPGHLPQNPAHPPPYPGHQPQNPAHPPPYPGHPPQNPAYPPPYPGHPPQNPAHPPPYPGHPPQNPAYPPQNPAYPAQNPAYPPQNPAVPPRNPVNPPQNPGYQPHNPGNFPVQPGYLPNPGYPSHGGGGWGKYDTKPWKPKPPKTNLKHMAGAAIAGAAAGAVGGYFLGSAMSNMRFRFNNPAEESWWHENRNRYSDRVYYPVYSQPVPRDTFVRDCVNITVKEYVEPTGNQTEDDMEARVVTQVVREMCIEQYRTYSSHGGGGGGGGGFSHVDEKPEERRPTKPVEGEAVIDAAVEDSGGVHLLGSALLSKNFQFNSTSEQQWWNDNRHRFGYQVFFPNYSQPVSLEAFMSDCENVTTKEYLRPSGNETDNEVATRVVVQVAHEMCTELYHGFSSHAVIGHSDNTPLEPMPTKLAMHNWPGPAPPGNVAEASEGNHGVPHVLFHSENRLMLASHSLLLIITGVLSFVIP